MKSVSIRIGSHVVTTSEQTAKEIVGDPAALLRLYAMMLESARTLDPAFLPSLPINRLRRRLDD